MSQDRVPVPEGQTTGKMSVGGAGGGAGAAIGTAIGTAVAAYFGLQGEVAAAVIGTFAALGGAAGAAVGAYVKRNYLTDPQAAIRQIEAAMRARGSGVRCHPLALLAALGLALALAGCSPAQGSRVSAAVERITSTVDVACRTLDGAEVRMTVDVLAAVTGQTDRVELVRQIRQATCASVGLAAALAPEAAPAPAAKPE